MASAGPSLLMTEPALSVGATAVYPYSGELVKRYTLMSRYGDVVKLWEGAQNGELIKIPRNFCPPPTEDTDRRVWQPRKPLPHNIVPRTEEQADAIERIVELALEGKSFCVKAPTGCHERGTKVLLSNGLPKVVEDVKVGDTLMGPDGKPRQVLQLCRGRQQMARITPTKGKSFVVNLDHRLSLKRTPDGTKQAGKLVDVTVGDWLKWSPTKKHIHKLWRVGVEYQPKTPVVLDPYVLGLWLGDGTSRVPALTTMDPELEEAWATEAAKFGLQVRKEVMLGNQASTYYMTTTVKQGYNPVLVLLRGLNVLGNKHIPGRYLRGTRTERLALLAGLIDTDGHVSHGGCEITFRSQKLADDALILARSLGFAAYQSEKIVNGDTYYRAYISGDLFCIPTRLARKKFQVRGQKKDVLVTGLQVELLEEDDFFGFTLDQDHLYLTEDFTVHHNSGKTVMAIAALCQIGVQTLIVVPKEDLFDMWIKELVKFGVPLNDIGMVRQDKYSVSGKRVVVGMLHSLAIPGRYPSWFARWPGLTVYDEAHRLPTDTFTAVAAMFASRVRIGLSATHERSDGMDVVVKGHIGPIMVEIMQEQMIPKVLVYKTDWMVPRWNMVDPVTGQRKLTKAPHSPGKSTHIVVRMCKDQERNEILAETTLAALSKGRKVVFFSEIIDHLERMEAIFRGSGVKAKDLAYYIGGLSSQEREEAAKRQLLLGTWAMFAEGTNIPALDTAVLATPRSDVRQSVGRIRRIHEGKKAPVVLDFRDDDSPVFKGYAAKRRAWYSKLGCEIVDMN